MRQTLPKSVTTFSDFCSFQGCCEDVQDEPEATVYGKENLTRLLVLSLNSIIFLTEFLFSELVICKPMKSFAMLEEQDSVMDFLSPPLHRFWDSIRSTHVDIR